MTRAPFSAVALLIAVAATVCSAQPPDPPDFKTIVADVCRKSPTAIECFADSALLSYEMCALVAELAVVEGNHARDRRCVSAAKAELAQPFERARKATAVKGADGMLKDVYAHWLTAIGDLMPKYEEARITYRQRRAQQKETLSTKLNRLKLEK